MKAICIAGRLGKDAALRRTQDGTAVLGFSVAVDDGYGQNKSTMWFDCSVWGKRAEALAQYLTKGTAVAVSGEFGTREHEGRTYLTVRVDNVAMQGGGQQRDAGATEPASQELDDEIPY